MTDKHPLDTGSNEEKQEYKKLESKKTEATNSKEAGGRFGNDNLIKSLAIVGIVILILIGLYGASQAISNLPEFGRSLASGFVSVTSQFFGTDDNADSEEDNRVIVIEEDDEEEASEEEENTQEETSQADQTPNQPAPTPTRTRTITREFRTVPQTITPRVSDPNGDVDLAVSIIATGKIDPIDRDFVEQDWLDEDDTGAVIFEVKNIGTKTSEEWEYRATFPTDPRHTYDSGEQMELRPGERMEFTISFDSLSENNNEFAVEVDPGRDIDDSERDNNRVEIDLDIRD